MYPISMIGLRNGGVPIARDLMEFGPAIGGHRRHGSPDLDSAGSVHDHVPGVSAFNPGVSS
jgi:hypothetical protein